MRLKKLEEAAERKAYQELVKDITPRKSVEEPFSSYKDQLGFGKFAAFSFSSSFSFYVMFICILFRICILLLLFREYLRTDVSI